MRCFKKEEVEVLLKLQALRTEDFSELHPENKSHNITSQVNFA